VKKLQRILHIEDAEDIRKIVEIILVRLGNYTVLQCASGPEAEEKAAAFAPDLILLDVMMPGQDGPETLTGLRAQESLKEIPVVFMTAKVQSSEIEMLKGLGAFDVLAKPFDPSTLCGQIEAIWSRYQAG
jgi:two-component system, OmpR family, response regulator